jgi:tripartite-type tricarboxylate transporter receptor subunit TctC
MTVNGLIRRKVVATLAFAFALAAPSIVIAQAWPTKPIRFIVPYPPGGTSDILARTIGQKLGDALGQTIVVENKPGANGNVGADFVAKAAPDGYTFLLADIGAIAISPSVYLTLAFDPTKDFSPVTMVAYSPHILAVHPSVPAQSVADLIALAKAKPGKLNYAASSTGSAPHLAGVEFAARSGIDWAYIPYKGGAQAITDVVGGQADVLFNGMLATLPYVKSGKLKLLAVSSEKRNTSLPDTPTVMESGVRDFVTGSWQGILAPGKTPPEILARMQTETRRILFTPDVREKLSGQGAEPMGSSPAETAEFMRRERERWSQLIRDTHYKL